MDTTTIDTADLARLNESDKAELRTFIEMENQRTKHQRMAHGMTDICWKKCFSSATIRSGSLDGGEATCLANCVDRFYDLRLLTLKHLQNSRTQ
ncbi:Tim10/DDP family zinc finger-domain-containing protein [Schizothecium vesticola]|uniref:Mitochondrial import inner membrane translocase subunit n=1 Tax=Schizothecium vesticola TaxID=314040 RepID=A0AA40KBR9_9PEZI|nr:Tim10/DDP family zinc finger-domain-containing protein [Schizothecium vesticola]